MTRNPQPASEDLARQRWMTINAARLAGVALVLVGILGLRDVIQYPHVAAWIALGAGLVGAFWLPRALARKWRTPRA